MNVPGRAEVAKASMLLGLHAMIVSRDSSVSLLGISIILMAIVWH